MNIEQTLIMDLEAVER